MTVPVRFLSAFVRKADIAKHYPGGIATFESEQLLGEGDEALYCALAMSGHDLHLTLTALGQTGFDTDRYVALADMWHGPIKQVSQIEFDYHLDGFPPVWQARAVASREVSHD